MSPMLRLRPLTTVCVPATKGAVTEKRQNKLAYVNIGLRAVASNAIDYLVDAGATAALVKNRGFA
jgi:fatty acid/phospholipid biosynthesis enzyme